VILSVGPNDSSTCSTTYANNTGTNAMTMFDGQINLPTAQQAPGVAPFTVTIPFNSSFFYVANMGKGLVADVRTKVYTPVGGRHWYLDALDKIGGGGTRTTVWNPVGARCHFNTGRPSTGLSNRRPEIGGSWYNQYNYCPPGLSGFGALATKGPGSPGLPIDLAKLGIGAPNCVLAISTDIIVLPLTTGTTGHARWPDVPVPNNPAFLGLSFFDQGLFFDPGQSLLVSTFASKWVIGGSAPPKGNHIYNFNDNPPKAIGHKFDQAVIVKFN
jgi:hypothetical protein